MEPFPLWTLIPFAGMLLSIAVIPLMWPDWWEPNRNKLIVSAVFSVPVLLVVLNVQPSALSHALTDYVSFMCLLGSLFVISSGVYFKGEFPGTPLMNTGFLATGAILANLVGTTGASMLLIRPYIRANHRRQAKSHLVVFFIFIVSNAGGLLTPLGDPPLYLGFLRGVPFTWTLSLLAPWALVNVLLLAIFNIYDQYVFIREDVETPGALTEDVQPRRRLEIQGAVNFVFLAGVMSAAVMSGYFAWPKGIQETVMILMAVLSLRFTPRAIHAQNHFHWHPIVEVAALFAGIFVTMVPALEILNARAPQLALTEAWHFFWASGVLSSFLDNAPTYLAFASMAAGLLGLPAENLGLLVQTASGEALLRAVSCGAVFMGANTYIGNGPNFMVKSIAERNGVKMPSFFGYMAYSGAILLPVFGIVTLVFFR